MKKNYYMIILILTAALLNCGNNQEKSFQTSDFHCQAEEQAFYLMDAYFLICSLNAPTDRKTLRIYSDRVYQERNGSKYDKFYILWFLLQGIENEKYIAASGNAYYVNGKLINFEVPSLSE